MVISLITKNLSRQHHKIFLYAVYRQVQSVPLKKGIIPSILPRNRCCKVARQHNAICVPCRKFGGATRNKAGRLCSTVLTRELSEGRVRGYFTARVMVTNFVPRMQQADYMLITHFDFLVFESSLSSANGSLRSRLMLRVPAEKCMARTPNSSALLLFCS